MPLTSGTTLGPYQIDAPLGAGGMGEVYKATDTRLDRTVAIKVLPAHVADDPDLRQRFEREAKTISSLNHPHICTLYDIGSQDGVDFLVMEYLDGDTLAQRLEKGALPLDQALQIAIDIADALDKAHRQGIVHRDLKPGNIMLTKAGAKLLDFGLAKLRKPGTVGAAGFSAATTASEPLTARGTLLGTLPYMAPEQVEGKEADNRTDVFAFGAVAYEMVTGQRAFQAQSQASLIGAILKDDPPLPSTLQSMTPRSLDRVIRRCLSKDPDERWQSTGDLRHELQWVATERVSDTASEMSSGKTVVPRGRERIWWAASVLLAVSMTWVVAAILREPATLVDRPAIRFTLSLPDEHRLSPTVASLPMSVSPDGGRIVYSAVDANGNVQLYLRALNEFDAQPIRGTEAGYAPFFSPDGQWVGFAASGSLKKVPLAGGPVLTIAEEVIGAGFGGASWGADDTIVFTTGIAGLVRVPAAGGIPETLATPEGDAGELSHQNPQLLPGDRAVLLTTRTGMFSDATRVEVLPLDSGARRVVVEDGLNARYAATGHIIYAGGGSLAGSLWAVPFDVQTLAVTGPPVRVLDTLQIAPGGLAYFTLAESGSLVYVPRSEGAADELVWVDATGPTSALAETPGDSVNYAFPRLSPDGERVAVTINDSGNVRADIWVLELDRGSLALFASEGQNDHIPVWTPDGTRITFSSNREGAANLYWQPVDGSGPAERLTHSEQHQDPGSWSPDGKLFAFAEVHPTTAWDLWVLDIDDRETRPFLQTAAQERHPMVSPDGGWLAYASEETGRSEVYVQAFPDGGQKQTISTGGGTEPLWARDGRHLFYRRGNQVVTVTVDLGPPLAVGSSAVVFERAFEGRLGHGAPNYEVAVDGSRFLMSHDADLASIASTQLHVVQNWFEELKARVPPADPS